MSIPQKFDSLATPTRPVARAFSLALALFCLSGSPLSAAPVFSVTNAPPTDISKLTGNELDPAIVISPLNASNMFVASLSDVSPGIFTAYSTNQGKTWLGTNVIATNGSTNLPPASGEPTVAWDTCGNLFLAYLPAPTSYVIEGVAVAVSTNGGKTFAALTTLVNQDATDEPRLASAALGGGTNALWLVYKDYSLANSPLVVQGLRSTGLGSNGGFGPVQIVPGSSSGGFPDIAVGPAGQVMVAYQNNDTLPGVSQVFVSLNTNAFGTNGFGAAVSATTDAIGGFTYISAEETGIGVNAAPGLAWDNNPYSTYYGRAYLVYTAYGLNTNLIVGFRYSNNNGAKWSAETEVDDDTTGNDHFFPRIAVDAATGIVAYSWFDCRNDLGAGSQALTNSTNSSFTFSNFMVTNVTYNITTTPSNETLIPLITDMSGVGTNYSVDITADDVYGMLLGMSSNSAGYTISIYGPAPSEGTNIVITFTGTNIPPSTNGPPFTNTLVSLFFTNIFPYEFTGGAGDEGDEEAELYTTVSMDGGATFQPNVPLISPTNSINQPALGFVSDVQRSLSLLGLGHYTGLAFSQGCFFPVWPDNSDITTNNPDGTTNFDLYTTSVVVPTADLSVFMTNSSPVISGAEITYILIVRNNGPSSAQNVVVTNTLPANVTFEGATPSLGGRYVLNGGILIFNWPGQTLKPGSSLTNLVYVQATTGQYITNIATVYGPLPDPIPTNNTFTNVAPLQGEDLALSMVLSPTNIVAGQIVTNTITISNIGPAVNGNVVVTNIYSANWTNLTVLQAPGSNTIAGHTISFIVGMLPTNQPATIMVTAVLAGLSTNGVISAAVSSLDFDPNLTNNSSTLTVPVGGEALALGFTASPTNVSIGQTITYTITVTNLGPSPYGLVTVTNKLSSLVGQVKVIQAPTTNPPVTNGTTLAFPVGAIATNQSATIVFTAVAQSMGVATDTAVVSGPYFNSNSSNDTNYTVVTIGAAPPPVTNFTVTALASSAFIVWSTPVNATVQVAYGTNASYGSISSLYGPSTNHVVLLTGLTRDTTYYYNAMTWEAGTFYTNAGSFATVDTLILNTIDAYYSGSSWSEGSPNFTGIYGSYFNVANTTDQNPTASATYTPTIPAPGLYNVFTWYPQSTSFSTNTQMYVSGATNEIIASVNQTTNGGSWQPLATNFYFASGTGGNVVIYNDTGETNKQVAANAMKWSYADSQDYPTNGVVPAWWSTFYFGTNAAAAASNYAAYVFGAPPNAPANTPNFWVSFPSSNTVMVTFAPYQGGRIYQLQTSTNLLNSQWVTLTNQPAIGTNATGSFTNGTGYGIFTLTQPNAAQYFFRLSAQVISE